MSDLVPGGLLDKERPPPPTVCGCGASYPPVWMEPRELPPPPTAPRRRRRSGLREALNVLLVRGRWAHQKVNPCPRCHDSPWSATSIEERRAMQRAQGLAGLPQMTWGHRWENQAPIGPEEQPADWMRRVRASPQPLLGVHPFNLEAVEHLQSWEPTPGRASALLLYGPSGTGKSLMASMLGTSMLLRASGQQPFQSERLPREVLQRWSLEQRVEAQHLRRDRGLRRPQTWSVAYVRERSLAQRQLSRHRSSRDGSSPLDRACQAGLLILDEGMPSRQPKPNYVGFMEDLIDDRYVRGLHLVITTNEKPELWLDAERCPYGERFADRLWEMTDGLSGCIELKGPSWRRHAGRGGQLPVPGDQPARSLRGAR